MTRWRCLNSNTDHSLLFSRLEDMSMGLLLALIIALMILSLPTWPYAAGWGVGYYPFGGLGIVLLVLLVVLMTRKRV